MCGEDGNSGLKLRYSSATPYLSRARLEYGIVEA
jgi:hypothetical protein